jgi:hypothetical protein
MAFIKGSAFGIGASNHLRKIESPLSIASHSQSAMNMIAIGKRNCQACGWILCNNKIVGRHMANPVPIH